jgi:hypothetical protein
MIRRRKDTSHRVEHDGDRLPAGFDDPASAFYVPEDLRAGFAPVEWEQASELLLDPSDVARSAARLTSETADPRVRRSCRCFVKGPLN